MDWSSFGLGAAVSLAVTVVFLVIASEIKFQKKIAKMKQENKENAIRQEIEKIKKSAREQQFQIAAAFESLEALEKKRR